MSQKIPFFELFSTLPLDRETRVALDGAYLTAAEVDRGRRTMHIALTVRADMGERMSQLSAAVTQAYGLEDVSIIQTVSAPQAPAGGKGPSAGGEVIMGSAIRGAVQPMAGLNPKIDRKSVV